jgi:hypothetical protein
MLSQAQKFAAETPMEASARAKLVRDQARALLAASKGEERAALSSLASIAEARMKKYEAERAAWDREVRAREAAFVSREQHLLGAAIPSKE